MDKNTIINQKYQITHLIGAGGFGEVYGAYDLLLKRPVAVKVLKLEAAGRKKNAERFLKEAQLTSQLSHPHTLTIFDFGQYEEQLFIVSEQLQGESLKTRLKRIVRYSPQRLIQLFLPICSALQEAHQLGVIHRDLKPDNLFLHTAFDEERLILIDFGIAKSLNNHQLTQSGQVFGTPHYMAPEQIKEAKNVDARADIYSLGIIFFEALSGELPFNGSSMFDIFEAHLRSDIPKLAHRLSKSFAPWDQLLSHMLTKDPKDRINSATAVAQALKGLQENLLQETQLNAEDKSKKINSPQSLPLLHENLNGLSSSQDLGTNNTLSFTHSKLSVLAHHNLANNKPNQPLKHSSQALSPELEETLSLSKDEATLQVNPITETLHDPDPKNRFDAHRLVYPLIKLTSFMIVSVALIWTAIQVFEDKSYISPPRSSSEKVQATNTKKNKNTKGNLNSDNLMTQKSTLSEAQGINNRNNHRINTAKQALNLPPHSVTDASLDNNQIFSAVTQNAGPNHGLLDHTHSRPTPVKSDDNNQLATQSAHRSKVSTGKTETSQKRSLPRRSSVSPSKKKSFPQQTKRSAFTQTKRGSKKSPKQKKNTSSRQAIKFQVFLKPKNPKQSDQILKVKLRLEQGKATSNDLKLTVKTKTLAKFSKKLKTNQPFKISKSTTIGVIKVLDRGQVQLKVCLKTFCKTLSFHAPK